MTYFVPSDDRNGKNRDSGNSSRLRIHPRHGHWAVGEDDLVRFGFVTLYFSLFHKMKSASSQITVIKSNQIKIKYCCSKTTSDSPKLDFDAFDAFLDSIQDDPDYPSDHGSDTDVSDSDSDMHDYLSDSSFGT